MVRTCEQQGSLKQNKNNKKTYAWSSNSSFSDIWRTDI